MISDVADFRSKTVEGQSENAKFDYLVFACTFTADNKPYFKSFEEYQNQKSTLAGVRAAEKLAELLYTYNADWTANLPEMKFLKKYKMVDSELRLINKDGKFVDSDGNLINADGELVDEAGNPVQSVNTVVEEPQPFLDDDGNPV